jgi:hypothetical protein
MRPNSPPVFLVCGYNDRPFPLRLDRGEGQGGHGDNTSLTNECQDIANTGLLQRIVRIAKGEGPPNPAFRHLWKKCQPCVVIKVLAMCCHRAVRCRTCPVRMACSAFKQTQCPPRSLNPQPSTLNSRKSEWPAGERPQTCRQMDRTLRGMAGGRWVFETTLSHLQALPYAAQNSDL